MTKNEFNNLKVGDLVAEHKISNLDEIFATWTVIRVDIDNLLLKSENRPGTKEFWGNFLNFNSQIWTIIKPAIVDLI